MNPLESGTKLWKHWFNWGCVDKTLELGTGRLWVVAELNILWLETKLSFSSFVATGGFIICWDEPTFPMDSLLPVAILGTGLDIPDESNVCWLVPPSWLKVSWLDADWAHVLLGSSWLDAVPWLNMWFQRRSSMKLSKIEFQIIIHNRLKQLPSAGLAKFNSSWLIFWECYFIFLEQVKDGCTKPKCTSDQEANKSIAFCSF